MATNNFEPCLRIVLKHEGGFVDHPRDPGGATNLGVTIRTLEAWRKRPVSKGDVRALTVADVTPIYRHKYWNPVNGDGLHAGVDLTVFDLAVNSGVGRARQFYAPVAGRGPVETIRAINDRRMSFLRALRHWDAFGRGWTARVADVRARSERMAREAMQGGSPAVTQATMQTEAARARVASTASRKRAQTTATTAAAPAAATPVAVATDSDWLPWAALLGVALIIGFVAYRHWHVSRAQEAVANAYDAVSEEPANVGT